MTAPGEILYQCVRCGNCCRWPGQVKVTKTDISALAAFLGIDESEFVNRFTRLRTDRRGLALIEKEDGSCIFLEGKNHCSVQAAKPVQCSGFPNAWRFPGWRDMCEAVEITGRRT